MARDSEKWHKKAVILCQKCVSIFGGAHVVMTIISGTLEEVLSKRRMDFAQPL